MYCGYGLIGGWRTSPCANPYSFYIEARHVYPCSAAGWMRGRALSGLITRAYCNIHTDPQGRPYKKHDD